MGWLMLVNPPKAKNAQWHDLQEIPDPFNFNFFRVLCWEMSGIQLGSITIVENRIERSEEQLLYGFQGNDEIGVCTTEHRSLFSSMNCMPLRVQRSVLYPGSRYTLPCSMMSWS